MKPSILCVGMLIASVSTAAEKPAGIPANYQKFLHLDAASPDVLKHFSFPDAEAWRVTPVDEKPVLEQFTKAKYAPPFRSPVNFALVDGMKFKDFILDVECQQTSKEYGHRDMVFIYGYQSPSEYYYTHIATRTDDHANQIFIVNKAPRTKISLHTNKGNDWGPEGTWRKVRIVRKASDGTIQVFFDDMTKPIMEARDKTFGAGWVGVGTFDDTCRVRSITVWGTESEKAKAPPFAK